MSSGSSGRCPKCYVCARRYKSAGGDLLDVSGYSDLALYQILEKIANSTIQLTSTNLCGNCVMMINCYDKHITKAKMIQTKMSKLMGIKDKTLNETDSVMISDDDQDGDNNGDAEDSKPTTIKTEENDSKSNAKTEAVFTCIYCSQKFHSHKIYRLHKKSHVSKDNNKESFMCENCGHISDSIGTYRTHKAKCGEQKIFGPFKCTWEGCERIFHEHERMQRHIYSHRQLSKLKEKPKIPCHICGKEFIKGFKMNRHLKNHEHVREHGCPLCSSRFAQRYNLLAHIKQTHDGIYVAFKTLVCHLCQDTSRSIETLRSHYENQHGIYQTYSESSRRSSKSTAAEYEY